MKKLSLVILVTIIFSSSVMSQENIVKINPLGLVFGAFEVGYERVLNDNQSLQVDLAFVSFDDLGQDYTGFGAGLQYRFYVQKAKEAPIGWFVGPFASYSSASSNDFNVSNFGAGGIIGYQWHWNPITLDIYGGPAYFSVDADDPNFDFQSDGIGARIGLSLGFGF